MGVGACTTCVRPQESTQTRGDSISHVFFLDLEFKHIRPYRRGRTIRRQEKVEIRYDLIVQVPGRYKACLVSNETILEENQHLIQLASASLKKKIADDAMNLANIPFDQSKIQSSPSENVASGKLSISAFHKELKHLPKYD